MDPIVLVVGAVLAIVALILFVIAIPVFFVLFWVCVILAVIVLPVYFYFKNRKKEEKLEDDMKKGNSGNY